LLCQLLWAETVEEHMRVAVQTDLVARRRKGNEFVRPRMGELADHEEGCLGSEFVQEAQQRKERFAEAGRFVGATVILYINGDEEGPPW
jgi:hypothetical protein